MDEFPIREQQQFFFSCLDTTLEDRIRGRIIDNVTPVLGHGGCVDLVREEFLQKYLLFLRRVIFFLKEKVPDPCFYFWSKELEEMARKAEIDNMSVDDIYMIKLMQPIRNSTLCSNFHLELRPTEETLESIGEVHDIVSHVLWATKRESTIQDEAATSSDEQTSESESDSPRKQSPRKDHEGKRYCCGHPISATRAGSCPHIKNVCKTCGKKEGHLAKVCLSGARTPSLGISSRSESRQSSPLRVNIVGPITVKGDRLTPKLDVLIISWATNLFVKAVASPQTGTTRSIIAYNLVRMHGAELNRCGVEEIYTAANGCLMACQGAVKLTLKVQGGEQVQIDALVSSHIHDGIIISLQDMINMGVMHEEFPSTASEIPTSATTTSVGTNTKPDTPRVKTDKHKNVIKGKIVKLKVTKGGRRRP